MIAKKKTPVIREGSYIGPEYEPPAEANMLRGPIHGEPRPRQVEGKHKPHVKAGKRFARISGKGEYGMSADRKVPQHGGTGHIRGGGSYGGPHHMTSTAEESAGSSSHETPVKTKHVAGHPQDIRGAHGGGRSPQPPKSSVNKPSLRKHRPFGHNVPGGQGRKVSDRIRSFGGLTTY